MAPPEALCVTAVFEPVQVLGKKEDGKELAFLSTFYSLIILDSSESDDINSGSFFTAC